MISNNILFVAFLALSASVSTFSMADAASTASDRKKFLRNSETNTDTDTDRKLKKSKSGGGGGGGGVDVDPNTGVNPAPPTPAPVKLSTTIDDWIIGCPAQALVIQDCVISTNSFASPRNCMNCLKGFSTLASATTEGASRSCASSATCGGKCDKEELAPFYDCGLQVDADFYGIDLDPNTGPGTPPTNPPVVAPTPTNPPTDPTDAWDTINCPAIWPGSGSACVMLQGYNYKYCNYYEFGPDALCTCRGDELIWSCVNGPDPSGAATPAEESHGTTTMMVVEKTDLTVVVVEETEMP